MHIAHDLLHAAPRFLGAGAYSAPAGKDFPPHRHPCWEWVYYRAGNIRCPIGEKVFDGRPGVLLLTPPGTLHAELAATAYANYYLLVDAPADSPWPERCFDDGAGRFERLCAAVVREAGSGAADRDTLLTLLLAEFDLLLRRERAGQALESGETLVRRAEHAIRERAGRPLRLDEIAREVGASPSALRARFARHRGFSPRDYLLKVRCERALALLRESDLTLDAIARLCGYDSASHLSRHVKASTGLAPGALRAQPTSAP